MSLGSRVGRGVPVETRRVAVAAFPKGSPAMRIRDVFGEVFGDEEFAELFPVRGRPGEAPGVLAMVSVLQFMEGLTDRQAVEAAAARIDWKYMLGWELTDPGFDFTVLSQFRDRVIAGGAERLVFDSVLEQARQAGLLRAGGRVRTDSTRVLAVVRELNRTEMLIETVRAALDAMTRIDRDWVLAVVDAVGDVDWWRRYSVRAESFRLPTAAAKRARLIQAVGIDGFTVLRAAYDPAAPGWVREIPAIEILRRVWVQQFQITRSTSANPPTADRDPDRDGDGDGGGDGGGGDGDGDGGSGCLGGFLDGFLDGGIVSLRDKENLPPAGVRIVSPYEPQARTGMKRGSYWLGYKWHATETCDWDLPHLLVHSQTALAPVDDGAVTDPIHRDLIEHGRRPAEHLVDTAYLNAAQINTARDQHQIKLIGPIRADTGWQNTTTGAYPATMFSIDWDTRTVTCPQGQTTSNWRQETTSTGAPITRVQFPTRTCTPCPTRTACTKSTTGRRLTIKPRPEHDTLTTARTEQQTTTWKHTYNQRAGIEATIGQATGRFDLRHCRYRGLPKTRFQHLLTATAINLARLNNWLTGNHPEPTRTSPFATLQPTPA